MSQFTITVKNAPVNVDQKTKDRFTVQLPGNTIELELKQDNEGANHWFEAGTDNETSQSREIGATIEAYLADNAMAQ